MERVPFLRDIEDETLYAKTVENAYALVYEQLAKLAVLYEGERRQELHSGQITYTCGVNLHLAVRAMRTTMKLTMRDMADRRARLADVAAGLADVVLDEEGSEE